MKFFQRNTPATPASVDQGAHEWAEYNLPADFSRPGVDDADEAESPRLHGYAPGTDER